MDGTRRNRGKGTIFRLLHDMPGSACRAEQGSNWANSGMPQVRQHGFDYPAGRVDPAGRAASAPHRGAAGREGGSRLEERGFWHRSWGGGRTGNRKRKAGGPTAAGSASCYCHGGNRCAPICTPDRKRPPCSRSCGRGTCGYGSRRDGRAGGLYTFRTAGSGCRGDVPVGTDAIVLGSRRRAGLSALLGLAGVLAVWMVVSNRQRPADPRPDEENVKTEATGLAPGTANARPTLPLVQFNRRWLPEQTLLFVDLRLSRLAKQPLATDSLAFLGPWWQPSSDALLFSLNLGRSKSAA